MIQFLVVFLGVAAFITGMVVVNEAMNPRDAVLGVGLATAGIILLLIFAITVAVAHDVARPDLNRWFDSLKSGLGACCSNADGTALADVDWDSHDSHYRVRLNGAWIDVPDAAVLQQPNRDGRTLVWPYYVNGNPVIRCFIPGVMT